MDKKFKALVVDKEGVGEESIKMLRDVAEVKIAPDFSNETLEEEAKDVDAIVLAGRGFITEKLLEKAPYLKVVGRIGVGLSNIDVETATKRGVAVVYSGEANSDTVADHVFGLMLAVARKIPQADHIIKIGFQPAGREFMGTDVWNKTLGIIGFGRIGYRVAKRARGFDMKILVYDPYIGEDKIKEVGGKRVDLYTLLKESDFVTIHTPITRETRELISGDKIKMMKDGAYLINAATGGIIDEQALYQVLVDGKLGGAALDTPETKIGEITIDLKKPLYKLSNVVVTPMIAAMTRECSRRTPQTTVEEVIKVLKKEKPSYIANPSVLK